ncbi:MAG: glycogen/starch synthase [Paludibacteraceae bacterium]|nr:glycogen/starch synthase [Paludibacteraceae bacterium]
MSALKVLYISQEITPYLPSTVRADLCRQLPQSILEKGKEVRIFMPKFGNINERRNQLHEVIRLSGMNICIDDTDHPLIIKVASIQQARMQVYFIDNEDFFQRKYDIADENGEFDDNEDRAIFFLRGVLETVKKLRWSPDVIHCHGWISALAPIYIKRAYNNDPFFKDSRIVYSVYDDDFKKNFSAKFAEKLKINGISDEDVADIKDKEVSFADLTRFALKYSDGAVQGSENINPDLIADLQNMGDRFVPYHGENYVDPIDALYDKVASSPKL